MASARGRCTRGSCWTSVTTSGRRRRTISVSNRPGTEGWGCSGPRGDQLGPLRVIDNEGPLRDPYPSSICEMIARSNPRSAISRGARRQHHQLLDRSRDGLRDSQPYVSPSRVGPPASSRVPERAADRDRPGQVCAAPQAGRRQLLRRPRQHVGQHTPRIVDDRAGIGDDQRQLRIIEVQRVPQTGENRAHTALGGRRPRRHPDPCTVIHPHNAMAADRRCMPIARSRRIRYRRTGGYGARSRSGSLSAARARRVHGPPGTA